MSGPEEVIKIVREWVAKAESDWKAVIIGLRAGEDAPAEVICFHAQQCVEKYLKAALVLDGVAFPGRMSSGSSSECSL